MDGSRSDPDPGNRGGGVDAVLAWVLAERVRYVYTDPRHWHLYEDAVFAPRLPSSLGWRHFVLSNHVPEFGKIAPGWT